jgi:hypothetical protein
VRVRSSGPAIDYVPISDLRAQSGVNSAGLTVFQIRPLLITQMRHRLINVSLLFQFLVFCTMFTEG